MKKLFKRTVVVFVVVVVLLVGLPIAVTAADVPEVLYPKYEMGVVTMHLSGVQAGSDGYSVFLTLNGYVPQTISSDIKGDFTEDELNVELAKGRDAGSIAPMMGPTTLYDTGITETVSLDDIRTNQARFRIYAQNSYYERRDLTSAVSTVIRPGDQPVNGVMFVGVPHSVSIAKDGGGYVMRRTTHYYYMDGRLFLEVTVGATNSSYIESYKVHTQDFQIEGRTELPAARLTTSKIYVDGTPVDLGAYLIGGNNYLKLRDVAYVLKDTPAEFNIAWDRIERTIEIQRGVKYEPTGAELQPLPSAPPRIVASSSQMFYEHIVERFAHPDDGGPYAGVSYTDVKTAEIEVWPERHPGVTRTIYFVTTQEGFLPTAYNVGGNNFYKLRDIAQIVGFTVDWGVETKDVRITTNAE